LKKDKNNLHYGNWDSTTRNVFKNNLCSILGSACLATKPAMYLKKVLYCGLYNPQCKRCRKYNCGLYNPQCI